MSNIKNLILPLVLLFIAVVLGLKNYSPATYLSGWDTLHPEFDFGEYFSRIFSVWQQHQGLGAVASQAHASELFRVLFYYLASFFVDKSLLRYGYFFLTLIVGPLGVYYFINENINLDNLRNKLTAFAGGLFYLLNLTTLQIFTVPFEMFATHFASIGWIFLFLTRYLKYSRKKDLFLYMLAIVLSASIAHTPTLFYCFYGLLSIYVFTFNFLVNKRSFSLKKPLLVLVLTLLLNLYWILPNLYYVKNYGDSVANSKIHSQFSDRALLVSERYGNIRDTILLKNFLFDWGEYSLDKGDFVYILDDWKKHFDIVQISLLGYIFFLIALIGFIVVIVKRQLFGMAFIPIFLISFFFIANDNFLFNLVINFLNDRFLTLREAIRFPFTKFSIVFTLCYTLYFSIGLGYLLSKFNKLKSTLIPITSILIVSAFLIIYMWPAFQGSLINTKMRVKIPDEYFALFDWFRTKDKSERIASFPLHSFWGWSYYNFGYEGAGFLWFGLRQPLLDREFDRWMPYNENYYWELSYALYSENLTLFENVLNKYQVKWILEDPNVVDVSSTKSTYIEEFEKLILRSDKIKLAKQFNNIKVYQVSNLINSKKNIALLPKLTSIGPDYKWNSKDLGYEEYGSYKSGSSVDIYYPFRSLFTNHIQNNLDFNIYQDKDYFIFQKNLPNDVVGYQLELPQNTQTLNLFAPNNLDQLNSNVPLVTSNGKQILVKVPKLKSYNSIEVNPVSLVSPNSVKNCDFLRISNRDQNGVLKNEILNDDQGSFIRLESTLADNCSMQINLSSFPQEYSYLITIESRNKANKSLLFSLDNLISRRTDIEVYLPKDKNFNTAYFIQPPMGQYGLGYNLRFDSWSFNNSETVNDLRFVSVYPFPYNFLSQIKLVKDASDITKTTDLNLDNIEQLNSYLYKVKLNTWSKNSNINEGELVLYQSFDPGWVAFDFSQFPFQIINSHQKVDSWANGWQVETDSDKSIWIVFLPQILEFLGMGIFVITVFTVMSPELKRLFGRYQRVF